jgi:hypothetical protein
VVQALKGNVAPPQMMIALISVGYSESDARAAWRSGQDMKQLLQEAIETKGLTIPEEEPGEDSDASPAAKSPPMPTAAPRKPPEKPDEAPREQVNGTATPSTSVEGPSAVIWMDYDGQTSAEITARRGDRFHVLQRDKSGWNLIKVEDNEGWIPDVYTRPTCAAAYQHHELIHIARDYICPSSVEDVQLSLREGEQVFVVTAENGWAYGYVRAQAHRRGWFPRALQVGAQ